MNIVHVSVATLSVLYQFGGAIQRRIMEVAKQQARMGHHVSVYSVGNETEQVVIDGVIVNLIKCYQSSPLLHIEFQTKVVRSLLAEKKGVDVIHFHSQPEGAAISKIIHAKKFLTYDYFEFRGGRNNPAHFLYRNLLNQFNCLLPVSYYCLEESRRYWNLRGDRMQVVYNGVNIDQFKPRENLRMNERNNLGINKKVLIYVGRVCYQKGTDILLEAVKILNNKRNDFQLVIAGPIGQFGNDDDPENWKGRISSIGGIYLGPIQESRLAAIYNMADIYIMPTRELEMFGMAAVEAQACGKPVIASDHGGLKEVVPASCGYRFQVGNSDELSRKIELLLDNENIYSSLSIGAVKNAKQYSWENICKKLDQVYLS